MAANPKSISLSETVRFTLNGQAIEALAQETILQAAKRVGIEIPYLCYKDGYRADGNCRACLVEIKGERVLAPACCRKPSEGMEVWSDNERARHSQTMVLELLLSDMPGQGKSPYIPRSELDHWGRVEMWRGSVSPGSTVAAPFVWRCLNCLNMTPFPHPAHRTGRADFPHPALGQVIMPSPTAGYGCASVGG
jgi:ferredoxin